MTYRTALFKRKIEAVFIFPFMLLGKVLSPLIYKPKSPHQVFIFCPSADIGGSIQVNIDLCDCLADKIPLVIFSKRPKNNQFLSLFTAKGISTIDLHKYIDYKWYHFVNFFYRGVIASVINKVNNPVIIGGESLFFYKVLPHIKREAHCIDICHLDTWFNYTQAFIDDIDDRVFSTPALKRKMEELYDKNKVNKKYYPRLHFIDNKVSIPEWSPQTNEITQVVFIGRGAPQKRIHLIASIAEKLYAMKEKVHFSFVGDVEKIINPQEYPYCTFYGNVKDKDKIQQIYKSSDILLLTSAYEGLPLVVMEMMAYGKVVVSTAVGGIPDYITHNENGFLIGDYNDETKIIEEAVTLLCNLNNNRQLLTEVSKKSRQYAEKHFSGKTFCENYRKVLFG